MILADTNVILDVIEEDPGGADWSPRQLDRAVLNDALIVSQVIYAELSIAFRRIEKLEGMPSVASSSSRYRERPSFWREKPFSNIAGKKAPGMASCWIFHRSARVPFSACH